MGQLYLSRTAGQFFAVNKTEIQLKFSYGPAASQIYGKTLVLS